MRKCGNCGQAGHNRRTCPVSKPEPVIESIVEFEIEAPEEEEEVEVVTCRLCYDEGHTIETCMYNIPKDKKLGPDLMKCGHFSWWWEDERCTRCNIVSIVLEKLDNEVENED
tara:strand:- start:438 stop:773 length:336 start_codon:yes stop_codon:yes gene_type:complete